MQVDKDDRPLFYECSMSVSYLNPRLREPDPHGQLLPHEYVRVVGLTEASLQLIQLTRGEPRQYIQLTRGEPRQYTAD